MEKEFNKKVFLKNDLFKKDYSFVVLPDTQNIIERKEEYYLKMMQWIRDNQDVYNIKAVLHMGDIVNSNTLREWEVAKQGFSYLKDIPFIPMMGNHDNFDMFNKYVSYDEYKEKEYFGGTYQEGNLKHFYWFVNCNEVEYLIISLGWAPSFDVLNWASNVINTFPNKRVIIISHALMHRNGILLTPDHMYSITSYDGLENYPEGYQIFNHFKNHQNIILMLSGHISSSDISMYIENEIPALLFDNQDEDKLKHLCMMGLLSFNSNECFVNWYSFKEEALYEDKNQFKISLKK